MALTDDHQFMGMTFVVIDFETLTPAGRPAEPIEVGAVAGQFTSDGQWWESGRYTALMRPPDDVQVTRFDVAQTGLRHRALPDVELTVGVFQAVLAAGTAARKWATLRDLDLAAGVYVKPDRDSDAQQVMLF